ncbi:KxYKxGKxW signal peptide domain-containing protein [Levilactobacillus mulengensis]|uniref:KxYKxGKxW signal peptide domain-containing protein n=1 Tax=Levilactobacillus mulengensis TaxID=2486025 RepID=UPI000F78FF94|nr:KxYKxGKxW signal peptide domain-containing protein [Levilactobacillus mulengensis]
MKQAHTPTTTKVHYKLYKAGKFWLVGTLATVSLVASLAVTNSAQADTAATTNSDATDSSVESETSSTDSKAVVLPKSTDSSTTKSDTDDTKTSDVDETTTPATSKGTDSSDKGTSEPASTNSETTDSNNSTEKSDTESSTNSTATGALNTQSTTQSLNTSNDNSVPADSTTNTNVSRIPAQTVKTSAVLASSGLTVKKSVDSLMKLRLAPKSLKHTAVSPVAETMTDTTTGVKPTAPTLSAVPFVNNLYITATGEYVLYNAKASANVYPYVVTNYTTSKGNTIIQPYDLRIQLYGFYVILPQTISGNLTEFQTAADAYVTALQHFTLPDSTGAQQNVFDIQSITAFDLGLTTDGTSRQVYYFRPNDGAKIVTIPSTAPAQHYQPALQLPISTGSSANGPLPAVQINAPVPNVTTPTMDQYIASAKEYDILFAGTNSFSSLYKGQFGYTLIPTSNLIANAPDVYMLGEIPNLDGSTARWAHTLTYVHVPVTDTYNVMNAAGTLLKKITVNNQDGSTYQRTGMIDTVSNLDSLSNSITSDNTSFTVTNTTSTPLSKNYWGISTLTSTTSDNPGTTTQEATLMPTSLEVSDPTIGVPGNIYTVTLKNIQTTLTPKDGTLIAGQSWDPADTLTGLSPDGSALAVDDAIHGLTPTLGSLTYTITDANNKPADEESLKTPGTYYISYSYLDAQGNTTTSTTRSTVTVAPNKAALTIAQPTISLTAGSAWNPTANVTSITAANGTNVKPADALTDKSLTVTVKDKDGNPVTIDSSTKPGTYTVVYHYTDPTTKLDVVSDPVTLTIAPAPTTGGASTPDNGETPTTPTTPVKPTNPAKTTKPAKTVRPAKPVTAKGVAIKDPPIRAIGEPQYTPGIQTGVTFNNAPLSGGEAAAALENQNGQANPATVLTQAQADQLAAERTTAREDADRNANANNANQKNQQNQLADGTNATTTLPQTNDQTATWTAQLGVLLLGLAGALGFRRKRN